MKWKKLSIRTEGWCIATGHQLWGTCDHIQKGVQAITVSDY
jgi:hypothetical protein